jgi:hypothetical protein
MIYLFVLNFLCYILSVYYNYKKLLESNTKTVSKFDSVFFNNIKKSYQKNKF